MKLGKVILISIFIALLASCAFAPAFEPTTMAGAQCKKECAHRQQSCGASSYTCDQGYASCLEACIDIDRISGQN